MIIDIDYDAPRQVIPLDHPVAVEAMTRLVRNLPPDVEIGRVRFAVFDPHEFAVNFPTAQGLFSAHSAHAERLLSIGDGDDVVYEFTSWTGGLERERAARSLRDLRPESA